jgi:hypothetical protein
MIGLTNDVELAKKIDEYEERYFSLAERQDNPDSGREATEWFHKARALSAVMFASDLSDGSNFLDSLYEAYAATGDIEGLRALCSEMGV